VAAPNDTYINEQIHIRQCRIILEPVTGGRLRLDAGTWGTMGVGLGAAIAAATARPDRLSVAVEGDSAFGFSGMECETICRWGCLLACFAGRWAAMLTCRHALMLAAEVSRTSRGTKPDRHMERFAMNGRSRMSER